MLARMKAEKINLATTKSNADQAETVPVATIKPPDIAPGVVPKGQTAPVAMDSSVYQYAATVAIGQGFPGFPYLSQLATIAEYRSFASAMGTEVTREWISLVGKDDVADKIKAIESEFERIKLREVIQHAVEHDCLFGRAQIYLKLRGHNDDVPLLLHPNTVKKNSLERITTVEAVWTTPSVYNAIDPSAVDFYKPSVWFMLGRTVHASRLLTIITRPLPDILKPAYNFAGMSLSQLAKPYVDNWLRTRQSVSDLIYNFSITALKTAMDQVLQGEDDGAGIIARAKLFKANRNNQGVMLLDKDAEDIVQINTPLSGLHELQAQSQEHMCSVSRMPAVVLTGISPTGLNASSEGELRAFYDWVAAQQEAHWRAPITTVLDLVQLSLFGEIDPDITFTFNPLYQMTPKELADIRQVEASTADTYVNMGALDPSEVRQQLADDPDSGFHGIEVDNAPELPDDLQEGGAPVANDAEGDWDESKHPRAANGQFGSGGGGGAKAKPAPEGFQDFIDMAKSSKTADELYAKILNKKDVPIEVSNWFREKYDPDEILSPKAATKKFFDEVNPSAPAQYAQTPGLNDTERAIETEFHDAVTKNGDKLVKEYRERFGNVIDPDKVKTLNPKFAKNPDLAAAVHEPSSRLSKMIYAAALEEKAANGDTSPTVFTAGGSGSGKSTTQEPALNALGANSDSLIYDSVLSSLPSATQRIDQALDKTKGDVGIAYTNANLERALYLNAKRERSVSIDTLLHAHAGAADTIRKLAEHYKDNPRVKIVVMNNLGKVEDVAKGSIDDVPKYEVYAMRKQLVREAKRLLRENIISREKYDLLIR